MEQVTRADRCFVGERVLIVGGAVQMQQGMGL